MESLVLAVLIFCSGFGSKTVLYSPSKRCVVPKSLALEIELGYRDDGTVTAEWIDALRYLRDESGLSRGSFNNKELTQAEASWAELIERRLSNWSAMVDSLRVPFKATPPPDTVTILLGNRGGEDAFVYSDATICFDLSSLNRIYGSATEPVNRSRIDRFFAHEFTHVLHKAWLKEHPVPLDTPFERALWECLTEGLGNYRSLSGKWVAEDGRLTAHAHQILDRLQPIFVQRLAALKHASEREASALMQGLSMGPFEQKWGALTVALWLAQEAKGHEANLQQWVKAGPSGVLLLAEKYLPEDLKAEIPKIIEQ